MAALFPSIFIFFNFFAALYSFCYNKESDDSYCCLFLFVLFQHNEEGESSCYRRLLFTFCYNTFFYFVTTQQRKQRQLLPSPIVFVLLKRLYLVLL